MLKKIEIKFGKKKILKLDLKKKNETKLEKN